MISPLISVASDSPQGEPTVGALATVLLFTNDGDKPYCCRIERLEYGMAWVKVIGLNISHPYSVGDQLTVDIDKVIDWE